MERVFGYYIRAASSLERNLCLRQPLQISGICTGRGKYGAQRDRIDADTRRQLVGQHFGHGPQPALGQAVYKVVRSWLAKAGIQNIDDFTRDDLVAHFHGWYVPENMVLCLTGNFDLAETERLGEELFGELGGARDPYEVTLPAPDPGPRWQSQPWGGLQTSFALSHVGVSYLDERKTPLRIASVLLGGGPRSVLFEALRERLGLTYHVSADLMMISDFGTLDVYCSVLHENLPQALNAVLEETYRVLDQGIEEETLGRIKERVRCWMEYKLDSPEEMASWFGLGDLLLGHEQIETPEALGARVQNTAADEVLTVMRQVFTPERRYLAVLGAEGQLVRKREIARLLEKDGVNPCE